MDIISLALVILATECCYGSINSKVIHIRPSTDYACDVKHCLTLSQLDNKLSHPISNATLILLSGVYSLYFKFSAANLTKLSIYPNSSPEPIIVCRQNASLEFKNISYLSIKGLKFAGCGRNKIQLVHHFILKESTFVGKNKAGTALEFSGTTGIIVNSSFISNKFGKFCGPARTANDDYACGHATRILKRQHALVGGAITASRSNLTIIKSTFEGNSAEIGGAIFATVNSNITIISSAFTNNFASNITEGSNFISTYTGGVLHIENFDSNFSSDGICQLIVLESEFRSNAASQGGVLSTRGCSVKIISSLFVNNFASFCGVILAETGRIMMLYNSTFYKNSAKHSYGVVYSYNIRALTVNLCHFANNTAILYGGTLGVVESILIIIANSEFLSNRVGRSGSVIYTDAISFEGKLWYNERSATPGSAYTHMNIHNTSGTIGVEVSFTFRILI